mmetsp:Transcript_7554/g.14056  ORF Transcript_7554/g.14056 Transcript_7554/m.14056 type:complete len:1248 (+) Transcript_7554:1420-5163(+)
MSNSVTLASSVGRVLDKRIEPDEKGLLLRVIPQQKASLALVAFNPSGDWFACADTKGAITQVNISSNRYSVIARGCNTTTALSVVPTQPEEIIVALSNRSLQVFQLNGRNVATLKGHRSPVTSFHFNVLRKLILSQSSDCVIIWDTANWTKVRTIQSQSSPFVSAKFTADNQSLLTSFQDGSIYQWSIGKFDCDTRLKLPCDRLSTFDSSSGFMAAGAGSLYVWEIGGLPQVLTSLTGVTAYNYTKFVNSSLLSVVANDGRIYLIDMHSLDVKARVADELASVLAYDIDSRGSRVAVVLSSGHVHLFELATLMKHQHALAQKRSEKGLPSDIVSTQLQRQPVNSQPSGSFPVKAEPHDSIVFRKRGTAPSVKSAETTEGCQHTLFQPLFNLAKVDSSTSSLQHCNLKKMLQFYGQYPEKYRLLVWRFLLQLPNNTEAYTGLYNKGVHSAWAQLHKKYPVKSQQLFSKLERVLSTLAYWSPIFGEVEYLPEIVFPFVKVCTGDDLTCFELIITFFLNWLQDWLVNYPNPPVSFLNAVEDIVKSQNPRLVAHLRRIGSTPVHYAWPLLRSLFSEALSSTEWLSFIDYLVTDWHQPELLLYATAQYILTYSATYMSITNLEDLAKFMHRQNSVDVKKLMAAAGALMDHGVQYQGVTFAKRVPVPNGQYPLFTSYPQYIISYQAEIRERMLHEEQEAQRKAAYLQELKDKLNKLEDEEVQFSRQVEALAASEADRRAALRIEEEIREMEKAKLAQVAREQRLGHVTRIEKTVAGSLKSQLDLRRQELRGLEEEIARRAQSDKVRIKNQLEEEGLATLELQATHRLMELMRLRTNEESVRKLKNEQRNWAQEQELKERIIQEQWKLEDEERRLKLELMREVKQKSLVEAAELADKAEITTKQKIAELERELQLQEVERERRLRQLAEDELIREGEYRGQLAQKENILRREEEFLMSKLKTDEIQGSEARLRERKLMLERERRETEAELAAEREAMHQREIQQRKQELESQLEDIRRKHQAKIVEEEKVFEQEVLKLEEERQRRRQMQLELAFKETELKEKTAFQHVLKETEESVMRDQRTITAAEREAKRKEMDYIEVARQKAHELKMQATIKQREQELMEMNEHLHERYSREILSRRSDRLSPKREAEDVLNRHEVYRKNAIDEFSADEASCSSCDRSLRCSHSSCSYYSQDSNPHNVYRSESEASSRFSSEAATPPFRGRDSSYTSESVMSLSQSESSPGQHYSRHTAML